MLCRPAASVASGNLLGIQILGLYPRPSELEGGGALTSAFSWSLKGFLLPAPVGEVSHYRKLRNMGSLELNWEEGREVIYYQIDVTFPVCWVWVHV
jgi:hypothetical protein